MLVQELILVDDHTHSSHTVNPLMVHVLVQPSGEEVSYLGSAHIYTVLLPYSRVLFPTEHTQYLQS